MSEDGEQVVTLPQRRAYIAMFAIFSLFCLFCCVVPIFLIGVSGNSTLDALVGPDYVGQDYRDVRCSDNKYQGIVYNVIHKDDNQGYELVVDIYRGDSLIYERHLVDATHEEVEELGLQLGNKTGTLINLYRQCNSMDHVDNHDPDNFSLTNPYKKNTDGVKAFFVILFIFLWCLFICCCLGACICGCICFGCMIFDGIKLYQETRFEELNEEEDL